MLNAVFNEQNIIKWNSKDSPFNIQAFIEQAFVY